MKITTLIAGLIGLAVVGTVAVLNCSVINPKKRKNACKFVKEANDISVSVIDEDTGEVIETTSDDILVPIDKLPAKFVKKKKVRTARPLTPEKLEKIKTLMKDGRCTVMFIAKKYQLTRPQAYAILYDVKREVMIPVAKD